MPSPDGLTGHLPQSDIPRGLLLWGSAQAWLRDPLPLSAWIFMPGASSVLHKWVCFYSIELKKSLGILESLGREWKRNLRLCTLHLITPPPRLCLSAYATNPFNYITSRSFSSKTVVISWSRYRQIQSLRERHLSFFLVGPIRDKSFELQKGFYPSWSTLTMSTLLRLSMYTVMEVSEGLNHYLLLTHTT